MIAALILIYFPMNIFDYYSGNDNFVMKVKGYHPYLISSKPIKEFGYMTLSLSTG
jgi:hypothetical protein